MRQMECKGTEYQCVGETQLTVNIAFLYCAYNADGDRSQDSFRAS